uniref:Uncharacterized protein n=1 Tax=Oryza barthii TaxID=65489 RepID=A0A0D3F3C5_9ORYZ
MAVAARAPLGVVAVVAVLVVGYLHARRGAGPGARARTSIDLGIAYILMLVALVLTYLIHPLDASSPYKLF